MTNTKNGKKTGRKNTIPYFSPSKLVKLFFYHYLDLLLSLCALIGSISTSTL